MMFDEKQKHPIEMTERLPGIYLDQGVIGDARYALQEAEWALDEAAEQCRIDRVGRNWSRRADDYARAATLIGYINDALERMTNTSLEADDESHLTPPPGSPGTPPGDDDMRNAIKSTTFEYGSADDDEGEIIAFINGTVELYDGTKIEAGGGWIEKGKVIPYDYADAGDVSALAEALDLSSAYNGEAMMILRALCPPTWPIT